MKAKVKNQKAFNLDFTANPKIQKLINAVPIKLSEKDSSHILCFRNIIELAWTQFRWNGRMASKS